jgi:tetratricopeptide (TPR) repeat protein
MSKPLKVFVTYSHKDTLAKDKLITLLAGLESENLIDIWHDSKITAGDTWRDTIFNNLADSDILFYLVSGSSLDSEICQTELIRSLSGNIRVIPIILERCDWPNHQLSDFQVLPDKAKPISEWRPESKGWENVLDGIQRVIDTMQVRADQSSGMLQGNIQAEQMFQRGHTLMMLGRIDEAIEAYSDTLKLNPHHAGAYANSIFVNLLKKKEQRFVDVTKPVVLTEGKTDAQYIQTALELLGEQELLNALEMRPIGDEEDDGDRGGGESGLDRFRDVYAVKSSFFHQPILLLYDWDANKGTEQVGNLWVRSIPKSVEDTKERKGIENLFPSDLFKDCFYEEKRKKGIHGKYIVIPDFNKPKFCKWICEVRRNPDDFVNFGVIVDILKEFRGAH